MPSVTLLHPVRHNHESYVAGDVIDDLTQKQADRLVRLGFARHGVVTVKASAAETEPTEPLPDGLSQEDVARIQKMKKSELVKELKDLGIEAEETETKKALQDKLIAAYSDDADPTPKDVE